MKIIFNTCPEIQGNIAIMIRHAERDPITNMSNALDALLTDKGKKDAFDLGQRLTHYSPINLYHSPVPRCQQTAAYILEGFNTTRNSATLTGSIMELGGPYITGNWADITQTIKKYGQSKFVRMWFNNEITPDIIMPLHVAAKIQLKIIAGQLQSGISAINITHDWNIMIVREYYFNLRHEDIGEPDFLDGFCAYIIQDDLHIHYHDNKKVINLLGIN